LILVDTSIWVDHLRGGRRDLAEILEGGEVLCHPFVIGEIALGHLRRRAEILGLLAALPAAPAVEHREALGFAEAHRLWGRGIGWVDVHLLASAALVAVPLWTSDKSLAAAAGSLGLAKR